MNKDDLRKILSLESHINILKVDINVNIESHKYVKVKKS